MIRSNESHGWSGLNGPQAGTVVEAMAIGLGTAILLFSVVVSYVLVSEPTTILDVADAARTRTAQMQVLTQWVAQVWDVLRQWIG